MKSRAAHLAPAVLAVAAAGYWTWPYIGGPTPIGPPPGADPPPEITAALLRPELGPESDRNPFHDPTAVRAPTPKGEPDGPPPWLLSVVAGVISPPRGPDDPTAESADPTKGLALNAVYIRGSRRVAVINGQRLAQGDALPGARIVVAEVRPFAVVLQCGDRRVELAYPAVDLGPGSARPASPRPKAAARGRASSVSKGGANARRR